MDYSDSELQGQIVLVSLVVLTGAAFLHRAVIFLRHESAGLRPLYPDGWKDDQRRTFERIRLVIGLSLVPLWAACLSLTPLTPRNWRFELILLMLMLLVSYGWTLLLAPRNLKQLNAFPQSFLLMIAFLVLCFGIAFPAIGWMLTEASASPPSIHIIPPGVYAMRDIAPGNTDGTGFRSAQQ
jgi:hypothetical protein